MSKFTDAESLLKDIAKQIKDNNYEFNHGLHTYIYHKLVFQNVKPEDRKFELDEAGIFRKWCREGRPNTNTFVSPTWTYFCQFISKDANALGKANHIKVYVPLDKEHVDKGVSQLFDFLDKNNISHLSKVGKKIRFDNVVIRLTNEKDLNRLLDFVNNNKYIQEGLIKPNAFAYTENNIAIACDGSLSYNNTVANYILLYMKKLKEHNALDNASLKGFYKFVIDYFAATFVAKRDPSRPYILKQFSKDFSYVDGKPLDIDDPQVINDYYFVTKLIIEASAKDYKRENFMKHYNDMNNGLETHRSVDFDKVNEVLTNLIETVILKHDANYTIWNIEKYIELGDPRYLTRFNDCRNSVCNTTFRDDMLYMLNTKNMTAHDYVTSFYNRMYTLDDEIIELLREYLAYGEYKYGREDTKEYLNGYISSGNDAYITRDSNFRDRFRKAQVGTRVRMYMRASGESIDSIIDRLKPKRM